MHIHTQSHNHSLTRSGAQFANTWAEAWIARKREERWKQISSIFLLTHRSFFKPSLIQHSMPFLWLAFVENASEILSCSTLWRVSHKFWINFIIVEWLLSVMYLLVLVLGCVHTNVMENLEHLLTVQFAMMAHYALNTVSS